VSETLLSGVWVDTAFVWVTRGEPVLRVGKSLRLYYLRPEHLE
jgi:hypothetical protein